MIKVTLYLNVEDDNDIDELSKIINGGLCVKHDIKIGLTQFEHVQKVHDVADEIVRAVKTENFEEFKRLFSQTKRLLVNEATYLADVKKVFDSFCLYQKGQLPKSVLLPLMGHETSQTPYLDLNMLMPVSPQVRYQDEVNELARNVVNNKYYILGED